jgi:hypothetical protein
MSWMDWGIFLGLLSVVSLSLRRLPQGGKFAVLGGFVKGIWAGLTISLFGLVLGSLDFPIPEPGIAGVSISPLLIIPVVSAIAGAMIGGASDAIRKRRRHNQN